MRAGGSGGVLIFGNLTPDTSRALRLTGRAAVLLKSRDERGRFSKMFSASHSRFGRFGF
jgi:hypothetical protein